MACFSGSNDIFSPIRFDQSLAESTINSSEGSLSSLSNIEMGFPFKETPQNDFPPQFSGADGNVFSPVSDNNCMDKISKKFSLLETPSAATKNQSLSSKKLSLNFKGESVTVKQRIGNENGSDWENQVKAVGVNVEEKKNMDYETKEKHQKPTRPTTLLPMSKTSESSNLKHIEKVQNKSLKKSFNSMNAKGAISDILEHNNLKGNATKNVNVLKSDEASGSQVNRKKFQSKTVKDIVFTKSNVSDENSLKEDEVENFNVLKCDDTSENKISKKSSHSKKVKAAKIGNKDVSKENGAKNVNDSKSDDVFESQVSSQNKVTCKENEESSKFIGTSKTSSSSSLNSEDKVVQKMIYDYISFESDKIRQNIYTQQMSFYRDLNKIKVNMEHQHLAMTDKLCNIIEHLVHVNEVLTQNI